MTPDKSKVGKVSGHTPGPWKVKGNSPEGAIGILQYECVLVAVARYSHNPAISEDEAHANAHLIAAAPELLEACKLAASMPYMGDKYKHIGEALENAINKAEGR